MGEVPGHCPLAGHRRCPDGLEAGHSDIRPFALVRRRARADHTSVRGRIPCVGMNRRFALRSKFAMSAVALTAALAVAAPAQADDAGCVGVHRGDRHRAIHAADGGDLPDPHVGPLLADHKDDDLYFVAPGGDFEDGAVGWQLEGGARSASARTPSRRSEAGSGRCAAGRRDGHEPGVLRRRALPALPHHRRPARRGQQGQDHACPSSIPAWRRTSATRRTSTSITRTGGSSPRRSR